MRPTLFVLLLLNIFYLHIDSSAIRCPQPELFLCGNNKCIATIYQCDGENDCGDESDEKDCADFKGAISSIRCATDEFQCADHSCIPEEKFCDARPDCYDKSDEYDGCVKKILKCDGFRCKDGHCIINQWVCDSVPDCPDNSDEKNCGNKTIPVSECNNEIDRYLCKNQRCIFLNATCNEKDDCGDNSDENVEECKKADISCKQTAKCDHNCRKTPEGAQCSCKLGYKLLDNRTCTDVDECENYGTCDQKCMNTAGSYMCSCQTGYEFHEDKNICKAEGGEALMVFSIKSEIRAIYLDSEVYFSVTRDLQHAVAVSLDANYVYWSDIKDGDEAIFRSLEDGSEQEIIVTTGLSSPDEIAVDWITGNIYFTDSGYMHIGVCNKDGTYCTIIIKDRNEKPRGLALLPSSGIMYWTEWGSNSRILMGGMDGRNGSALITENLEWPNSLTIDYANNRLYWVDSKLKVIESIRLDGSDRRTILHGIAKRPFSIAVFENKLYWSDWISNTIQSCDKFTGKDWKILAHTNSTIYGIHVYHSILKPKIPDPCNSNPCSQLCLLNSGNGYTCACTVDKELNPDQHTCRAIKKGMHLIIAAGNTFIDYYHELLGKPKMTPSITLKQVTEITYNPLTGGLLASDQLAEEIFNFDKNTGDVKPLKSIQNKVLGGIDFDYIGNNLYFSDMIHDTIEVHSLSTNKTTVFYFQEEPRDIALVPEEGIMFVVFRKKDKYRIDLMNMNGVGRRMTIEGEKNSLLGPDVSLCYDKDLKQLFWSDQGTGRIGITTINDFETHIFRTGLTEPVSLAVLGDHVFWTQQQSNQLYWTSKSSTEQYQKRIALRTPPELERLQLVGIRGTYVSEHECHRNNGNCSHVCLVSNLRSHICACPPDMMLNADNRTCSAQTACKPGEIKCSEHDICIKLHQRCDGVANCPNGEDESSICGELHWLKCEKTNQFACKSGACISKTKRCNSHYDCPDRSDEEGCDKKECNSNEFECHEGACISKYQVCDGHNDCSDGSDESNCDKHTCGAESFACDNGMCIPKTWACDGEPDCLDRSDESSTCRKGTCPSEMFTCHNGRCIDSLLKCNTVDDCDDNSDEQYCTEGIHSNSVNCTADEYKCYNVEMCIPKTARCNGRQDCPKNDDERNCVRCQKGEYACDNQNCIDESWVCDRVEDCGDGSDERDCDGGGNSGRISLSTSSKCKEFKCSNGACLPFEKVCDGAPDCLDRSDESGKCAISCTKENFCDNICHKTPSGPVCGCRKGFQLSSDLKSCEDINECESSVCSQACHNTDGSFTCSCYEGYVLRGDKISCKVAGPQMELITVAGSEIRKLKSRLSSIEILYDDFNSDITGIDVNVNEGAIYWSSDALGMISKIHINSKTRTTVTGVGRPEALAVDWITDNVYFNDNDHASSIKVCNLEQQKCAEVVSIEKRNRAMSIVVDPKQGWLFWSQTSWIHYDVPTSKIYRSTTTGSNATAIIYRNIGVVSALAIDYARSRLYWADTFLKTIESSNFDGSERAILLKTDVYHALSMNIYEDNLYWLMGTTGTIKKCKLYGDRSCTAVSIGTSNIDKHFTIMHTSRQPIAKNTCEDHKCKYMCLMENNSSKCICPTRHPRDSEGTCGQDTHPNIKFISSTANRRGENVHRPSGALIATIIMIVLCIAIISAYFYYQKVRPAFSTKYNLSMRFQNPSYDRRSEIAALDCIAGLPPGEHEYVNPVINIPKNEKVAEKNGKPIANDTHAEQLDEEFEDSGYKLSTRLI